jgi:hypothetical protein
MSVPSQVFRRLVRDVFIVIGFLAVVLICGCVYYYSRHPQFSGPSPLAIDVRLSHGSSTNDYRTTITNRAACEAIQRGFREAHGVFSGHKAIGELTFRYANGKTDTVWMMPGLPGGYSDIYLRGAFRLPSDRFYQILKGGGVDASEIQK